MTEADVKKAIDYMRKYNCETQMLEAKSAKESFPKKCYDTISSFANKYGGLIIFGISEENDFATEGVYDVKDLQNHLSSLCTDSMQPAIRPYFLALEFEGKNILAVKIDEIKQNEKPCYYRPVGMVKGSYIRVDDHDEVMTDYEIYTLKSYNEGIKEDLRPIRRASLEDLDEQKILNYVKLVKENKPNFAKNNNEKILKLSGIIDYSNEKVYPTLAGLMLFGKWPQAYLPQVFVACSVIPGTILGETGSMGQRFNDNKRVEGTIEEMLDGTLNFISRNMKYKVIVGDDGRRHDVPEYPIKALREAVANALIHRDYSVNMESCYIQVYMYADRIEILSPGSLYGVNKIDKLGTSTIMEVRNETIMRILEEKTDFIENRHTGIQIMRSEMQEAGLPKPIFQNERDGFRVIFKNTLENGQIETKIDPVNENTPLQIENFDPVDTKIDPVKNIFDPVDIKIDPVKNNFDPVDTENTPPQISEEEIIKYCSEPRTAKEIANYFGYSSAKYFRSKYLAKLVDEGKLIYTKKGKNAHNQKYIRKEE